MRHSIEIDRAKMTWSSFKMAGQKWHDRLRSWQPPIVIWCHFANLWCIFKFDIWWTIGWPLSCTNFQETKCLAIIQVSSNEMLKCWIEMLKCWNVEIFGDLIWWWQSYKWKSTALMGPLSLIWYHRSLVTSCLCYLSHCPSGAHCLGDSQAAK